jgi:hypothetical protein
MAEVKPAYQLIIVNFTEDQLSTDSASGDIELFFVIVIQ